MVMQLLRLGLCGMLCLPMGAQVLAQADLIVETLDVSKRELQRGEPFQLRAVVRNVGDAVAGANYAFVYSTDKSVPVDLDIRLRLSVPRLGPGEATELFATVLPSVDVVTDQHLFLDLDVFNEVVEKEERNGYCFSANGRCEKLKILTTEAKRTPKLGAPVIFIHGLNSDALTWDNMIDGLKDSFQLDFGGVLHYCLNPDGDQETSDGYVQEFPEISSLRPADMYSINFDVSKWGKPYVGKVKMKNVYSNQSAIAKQGIALSFAIERVLEVTGAEEVILLGHSMGGLAAREYLQNPDLWIGTGERGHRVRQLMTWGTPHGGCNMTFGKLDLLGSIDDESEATRDLRYTALFFKGYYLDGGTEVYDSDYHNMDIDINGRLGDVIRGKNRTPFPTSVNLSSVAGDFKVLGLGGIDDGVVNLPSADMRRHLYAATPLKMPFIGHQIIEKFHTSMLEKVIPELLKGLDEPDGYSNPEHLRLPALKYGYITKPLPNHPEQDSDQDIYWFEIEQAGDLKFAVDNIPVRECGIAIADAGGTVLNYRLSEGAGALRIDTFLKPGAYQLIVEGVPTGKSYHFPYTLSVGHTPLAMPSATFTSDVVKGCNPLVVRYQHYGGGAADGYAWSFPGGQPATSTAARPEVTYASPGTYAVELAVVNRAGSDSRRSANLIQVEGTPKAIPSYTTSAATTVKFSPNVTGGTPTLYRWTFGDGTSSTEAQPTHTYAKAGTYAARLVTGNSCGATTAEFTVALQTSGMDDGLAEFGATLYPNPFSDQLTLKLATPSAEALAVEIYTVTGQRVMQARVAAGTEAQSFAVAALAAGVYMVRLVGDSGVKSWRVVRE